MENKDTAEQPVDTLNDDLMAAMLAQESEEEPEEVEEAEPEETEEAPEETEESEEEEETEETEEEDPLEPPTHWAAVDRELFAKQPRGAQEFLLQRHKAMEADYTRKTQEVASIRKRGEAFEEVLAPYRQEWAMTGLDDVGAVRTLLAYHDALKTNPLQAIQHLAQTYGADLAQIGNQPQVDPVIQQVRNELQTLRTEQHKTLQEAQQRKQQELVTQIQSFEAEKDDSGNLKHPFFQDVYDQMVRLFQTGGASSLDEAYAMSVAVRPELQSKLSQKLQEKDKEAERKKKVDLAKRAKKAASGVKSSGASVKKSAPTSLEDEIRSLVEAQG